MTSAYERILELARREAALVHEGRFEELAAVWAERDDVIGVLEETPPSSAREPLLEAERICRATRASLLSQLQELGGQIARLSSGRRAAAGYGGMAAPRSLDARG